MACASSPRPPPVSAIQVYAPPEKDFIVLEPQLNWADPFGPQWSPDVNTGMAVLKPGESIAYSARIEWLEQLPYPSKAARSFFPSSRLSVSHSLPPYRPIYLKT